MDVVYAASHLNDRAARRGGCNGSTTDSDASLGAIGARRVAVGPLVRNWRIRALLTQEELAARAGLSVRTIRRLEGARAAARPRLTSIKLLAKALNLDDGECKALVSRSYGLQPAESSANGADTISQSGLPEPGSTERVSGSR